MKKIYNIIVSAIVGLTFISCTGAERNNPDDYVNDHLPPGVVSVTPENGSIGVHTNTSVIIVFNDVMDAASIDDDAFILKDEFNHEVNGTLICNGKIITFTPAEILGDRTTYTMAISTQALDFGRNPMQNAFASDFMTGDFKGPGIISTSPDNLEANVERNVKISVVFGEDMNWITLNDTTFKLYKGDTPVKGVVSYDVELKSAYFDPISDLDPNTLYTATILSSVEDMNNNSMNSDYVWSFRVMDGIIYPVGIYSHWKLDENSGDAVDALGHQNITEYGNIGSVNNGPFGVSRGNNYMGGNPGAGFISLTGNSATVYDSVGVPFIVEAWVKLVSGSVGPQIFFNKGKIPATSFGWSLWLDASERAVFTIGTVSIEGPANIINDGEWHYLVGWLKGTGSNEMYFYVDNVLIGQNTRSSWSGTSQGLAIGVDNDSASDVDSTNWPTVGYIQDCVFWNTPLSSQTEVEELIKQRWNDGKGRRYLP